MKVTLNAARRKERPELMPDYTYHPFLKPLLFRLRPEVGRRVTLRILEIQAQTAAGRRLFRFFGHGLPDQSLGVDVFGLRFPSPIGLGPGIDTHGVAIAVMQHLGFGFLEVGPVGDLPVPHKFSTEPLRIVERQALVASGQASAPGASEMAARIKRAPDLLVPIGMALRYGANMLAALGDGEAAASFFTLPSRCADDLDGLRVLRAATKRPLLLRLSPDWTARFLEEALERAVAAGLDGCVAVGGSACPLLPEGEIEGPFLHSRALATVAYVARRYGERFPVIGAGGIHTPDDALALLDAGARLVELSAGLVYAGPGLPGRIIHALEHRATGKLHRDNGQAANTPETLPAFASSSLTGNESAAALSREPFMPEESAADGAIAQTFYARALSFFGWPSVALTGAVLIASGLFALLLAATVQLLPPDIHFLGMTVEELCAHHDCRIVYFLAHDRVSFGGSIIAVGILYVWLARVPLRRGEAWAWWTLLLSGAVGFGSFLTYLGYGYLDVWHAWATIALLPFFVVGLIRSFVNLRGSRHIRSLLRPGARAWLWSRAGTGRACLTFSAVGMILGGLTIMGVGITSVFVPQDLEFMRLSVADLNAINPRLVPLIAHDRAGFGGGLCSGGLTVLFSLWCGARPRSRGLWLALCLSGFAGFASAIGIHPVVGYHSFTHLLPAFLGAIAFVLGIILLYRPMCHADEPSDRFPDS